MNNLPNKVKAVDVLTKYLEPILLGHGFRRCKKGYYVRMRGEILQTVYFYTYRPPAGVRFAAVPYWAVEEEWLEKKDFDSFFFKDVSDTVNKIEEANGIQLDGINPFYYRWIYVPNNPEQLNSVAELYAEKIPIYILPILDRITNLDAWLNCTEIHNKDYFLPVAEYLCVLDGNYDRFEERLRNIDQRELKDVQINLEFIRNFAQNITDFDLYSLKKSLEVAPDDLTLQLKLEVALNPCEETIRNFAVSVARFYADRHREELKKYSDLIETGSSTDILKEGLEARKIQMREAVKKHLKLNVK